MIVSSPWEVRAQHSAGSIAVAVRSGRIRNMVMGLGILGVLAIAAVLLLIADRRAQNLAQQQREFVAGVTHELRTPLTVIRSAAENTRDGVVENSTQIRRYGKLIHDEGLRLSELVEQALVLAGARSAQKTPLPCSIALADFLPDVLERCRVAAGPATLSIDLQIPQDTPPVLADPRSLERALSNLLGNAFKYSGDAPVVGVRVDSRDPHHVDVTVWDQGPGIPEKEQRRLFEPFYRGRFARESQLEGSGLGLSVVQQTVEAFGGSVSVESESGSGSAFTLHLPTVTI